MKSDILLIVILWSMQVAGEILEELAVELSLLEMRLQERLYGLPPESLTRLCREVVQNVSSQISGVARQ